MPDLTQDQKDKLARFAGLKPEVGGYRYFGKGKKEVWFYEYHVPNGGICHEADWLTKPEHFWLVFEALIKKTGWWFIQEKCRWFIKRAGLPDIHSLVWFKDVICNAALAIIE